MAWVIASFILQITYLATTNEIIGKMEEAEEISEFSSCSNALAAQAFEIVTRDQNKPETVSLVISIVFGAVCILLWCLTCHADANLTLEQVDLIDEHFPPGGGGG